MPIKPAQSLPSAAEQGRKYIMKDLTVQIRVRRDYSLITVVGKTNSAFGNEFN